MTWRPLKEVWSVQKWAKEYLLTWQQDTLANWYLKKVFRSPFRRVWDEIKKLASKEESRDPQRPILIQRPTDRADRAAGFFLLCLLRVEWIMKRGWPNRSQNNEIKEWIMRGIVGRINNLFFLVRNAFSNEKRKRLVGKASRRVGSERSCVSVANGPFIDGSKGSNLRKELCLQ